MENSIEKRRSPEQILRVFWEREVLPLVKEEHYGIAQNIFQETLDSYAEKGREYHTIEHILFCLNQLETYRDHPNFLQLWLALLWHDVVYDTKSHHNEEDSAYRAAKYMEELGLPNSDIVQRYIISTKYHDPDQEDERLVCSIDMMILAAEPAVYEQYAVAIRREYGWVSDEDYRQGRASVLRGFSKPFTHPDFLEFNEKALQNINRERAAL